MEEVTKVGFTIEGEFITDFFRGLWVEENCVNAYTGLQNSLIGEVSDDIVKGILDGKFKLVGTNELSLEDDNVTEMHGIQLFVGERVVRLYDALVREISAVRAFAKSLDYEENYSESFRILSSSERLVKIKNEFKFLGDKYSSTYYLDYETLFIKLRDYEESYLPVALRGAKEAERKLKSMGISVEDHIETSIELNKIESIEPTDDYSHNAIWISPKGLVYGMTGDIANMLHIRMADLIAPTIPVFEKYEGNDGTTDAYSFLESIGYIKLTNNWALMDVDQNENYATVEQMKILYKIAKYRNVDFIEIGYIKKPITTTLLEMIDTKDAALKFSKMFSIEYK